MLKKARFYMKNPKRFFINLLYKFSHFISNDSIYIRLMYLVRVGKLPNLKHPKTFTEKLQWIKLHDRKTIYHDMVDKVEMKKIVEQKLGKGYTIDTIGVWNSFSEIDFSILPEQFILKCTHDSGSYSICLDKAKFDIESSRKKIDYAFKKDYYLYSREWPYKGLKRRIIAEPLLKDNSGSDYLRDYKFYCFNGEPKFFYITSDRGSGSGLKEDFFYINGERCEFSQLGENQAYISPELPNNLGLMVNYARLLSADTYHLRVDFYEVNDRVFVGELTFFDGGGFYGFHPDVYNQILGSWISIPLDK